MLGLAIATAAWSQSAARADWVVSAGFDLFQTVAADTSFPGLGNLMGVPLGTFDFGSGPVATGLTDTIVERLSAITVPETPGSSGVADIQMRALQLETVVPVDFGGNGLNNYFVTLDPTQTSGGTINIVFDSNDGGTWSSNLVVNFAVHQGALDGNIVFRGSTTLANQGDPWGRIPPPNAMTIPGVNEFLLAPGNRFGDFWSQSEIHTGPHGVITAMTPEPSTWAMLVAVGLIVPAYAGWSRRRS